MKIMKINSFILFSFGDDWYCDCVPGYSGRLCSNKLCVSNVCLHGGTCVVMETENDQLCLCPLGRGGILCEEGKQSWKQEMISVDFP